MAGQFDLSGKVAIVTGGGRGIGRAIALGLAEHGAELVLCGRNEATLAATALEIGSTTVVCQADVSREDEVLALADRVRARHGRLDILVNNAGIDPHYAKIENTSTSDWQQIIDVNLTGVFQCCRHLGALMLGRGGSIINISSIAGRIALKRQVPYCASKGGVEQITKALAVDWAGENIRVNAIAYGFIRTDLTEAITSHPYLAGKLLERTPMGRFGDLSEVAAAAIFLASSGASFVTGHTLVVDGGLTAA
jgi:NAD(P)-dependent dehydrogenase (short-subunit alcohol dehydrogenase family)